MALQVSALRACEGVMWLWWRRCMHACVRIRAEHAVLVCHPFYFLEFAFWDGRTYQLQGAW